MPEIGDAEGPDEHELVWAPLDDGNDGTDAAAYLRCWSLADREEAALEALWKAGGDVAKAEAAMTAPKPEDKTVGEKRALTQDAGLGALLTAAIIEHRKDLVRAKKALANRGTAISLNAFQRFYYAHWRRSNEAETLATAMDQEQETDDGLDDHCAICGQRGLLVCCDACSNVYHLACVRLSEVRTTALMRLPRVDPCPPIGLTRAPQPN